MNDIHNSIQGLEVGTIWQRLVYALFLILGIFFFVASLSTVFEVYSLFQTMNAGPVGASTDVYIEKIVLRLLYVLLNFIAGYSLVFCRKWSMLLFATNAVLMGGAFIYAQFVLVNSGTPASSFTAFILSTFVFLILYLFKKNLHGNLYQRGIYITYLVLLLVTFTLTYLI